MSEPRVLPWTLPRHLTADAVDGWLASEDTWRAPVLRLGQDGCTADPSGAARLQGALCLLRRAGLSPTLHVPETTLAGDRADAAFAVPSVDGPSVTPAEKTLASSAEGLVLGQLCELVPTGALDTDRLRGLQADELRRRAGVYGRGRGQSLAVRTEGDTRSRKADVRTRVDALETRLVDLLQAMQRGSEPWRSDWFPHLSTFALEATENTFDHGRFDFDNRLIPSIRLLTLTRHRPHELLSRGTGTRASAALGEYLRGLEAHYRLQRLPFDQLRLAELTVADGGVGVAAHMAGTLEVYREDGTEWELKALAAAYTPQGTGKPPGLVGVGEGLKKMLRSAHRLRGLVTMTTGRFELARTYLEADGRMAEHDFENRNDGAFDISGHVWRRPLLAGTTCTLLFPLPPALSREPDGRR